MKKTIETGYFPGTKQTNVLVMREVNTLEAAWQKMERSKLMSLARYEIAALIRAYLYEVNNRTKATDELFKKLGKQLRKKFPRDYSFSYLNDRIKAAWDRAFGIDTGVYLSIGHIVRRLYELDTETCNSLVGAKVWERSDNSFYYADGTPDTEIEMNTNKLLDELIKEFGFKPDNNLSVLHKTVQYNQILEGKTA